MAKKEEDTEEDECECVECGAVWTGEKDVCPKCGANLEPVDD